MGRRLGFLRLAVSSARNARLEHAPSIGSSNKRPQPPGWGRFLDIRIWPFKVLVEGDHAIAAVRWPLVQVALAVAIVGVVGRLLRAQ